MRLYYFTSERYGLEAIRDKKVKIATIEQLNDPFELLGMQDEYNAHAIGRKAFSRKKGFLCFSESWQSPLMWGHYADNHKGICLGFDVKEELFKKVSYIGERYPYTDDKISNEDGYIYYTKFKMWSYEQEYRYVCDLVNQDPVSDLFFEKFSPDLQLKQIIIGLRSKVTPERIQKSFGGVDLDIFKVAQSAREFKVIRSPMPNFLGSGSRNSKNVLADLLL